MFTPNNPPLSPPVNTSSNTPELFEPLSLKRGPAFKNRLALAPLTNTQSHPDGCLSDAEYQWLTLRAQGGFGLVTTCASHVQENGRGFPGQLGCFSDTHLPGLKRLAEELRSSGAVSSLQLHHAGSRSPEDVVDRVAPSQDEASGARALTEGEVEALIDDFVSAAIRAERAGFDGVQVHGAHGYIIAQFLSPELNQRADGWGGSLENRSRLLFSIIEGIRRACRADFQLGVRISPERFGLRLPEMVTLAERLFSSEAVDYVDLSLWDVNKEPEDQAFQGQRLMSLFTSLERGETRLGVAGKILGGPLAAECLERGADYALIGRGGILAFDFPKQVKANPSYQAPNTPVSPSYLKTQGLSDAFIEYMHRFPNFVAADIEAAP